ncbi:Tm-1-like ATP-binding domain-containing protein [Desulfovibrio sp. OttesenSCG-928-C14]|nr:Tm-1-like ATP-binding domain-containing protein [Desulfovibrio sp. OttesenSCG-928-C14]
MKKAYVIGTCDTKFEDHSFVRDCLNAAGIETVLVDVGIFPHKHPVDVTREEIAAAHPEKPDFLSSVKDRGEAVILMSEALAAWLKGRADIGGVIGMGGSGGSSIVSTGMRALDVGVPKLLVSTVASGDVSPYVGPTDITMMPSITDVAGINRISRVVFANAAHALAGMMLHSPPVGEDKKPLLGLTMFGVTTPCVEGLRDALRDRFEPIIFHATGTGGQSIEKLIDSGLISHVIDATTTEICDLFMGGVLSAGPDRLGAIIRSGIPYVGSVGAMDMVNFGPMDTVPEKYRKRLLHVHNATVTLMRTTPAENREMGLWIADKLNQCRGPVRFLLPEKGVSILDAEGMPFYDPEADEALFSALEERVEQNALRRLIRLPHNINDPEFIAALISNFEEITE